MLYNDVPPFVFQSKQPFGPKQLLLNLVASGTALEMEKGHISLVPYSVVEQLVARGEVELV
jgi:DNA replication complex GINS protein SLD5 C-terminus